MSEAAKARRRYRREEWATQTTLARLLTRYLDPQTVFWTSLENKPSSRLNGLLQKRRGVRSGLPDTMVVYSRRAVFVELKSKAGVASKSQKQVRAELVAAGARWWMARSVGAALTALHRSGVPFRAPWKPPSDLREWEGPFTGEEKRVPQHPLVREKQREACRRWREKRRGAGLKVRSEPTERRRAQTREATRRWRERRRAEEMAGGGGHGARRQRRASQRRWDQNSNAAHGDDCSGRTAKEVKRLFQEGQPTSQRRQDCARSAQNTCSQNRTI
jgi:hypothetical protein